MNCNYQEESCSTQTDVIKAVIFSFLLKVAAFVLCDSISAGGIQRDLLFYSYQMRQR